MTPGDSYLVQFPVELSRAEGISLVKVLAQQENEAAVVHVQGIVVPVHLYGPERGKYETSLGISVEVLSHQGQL